MGKRARRWQRANGERKQPNQRKREFVESKVGELKAMDEELRLLLEGPDVVQGP